MRFENQSIAARAIDQLDLGPRNAALAAYWLLLWEGGRPPSRSAINPARIKSHLPGLAIFEVTHAGPVVCRLAGTAIDRGLGFSLTGRDFMTFVDGEEAAVRHRRLHFLVSGAIAVARTPFRLQGELELLEENILLPLHGISETGSQQFILHTNVRPSLECMGDQPAEWNAGLPQEYIELDLY